MNNAINEIRSTLEATNSRIMEAEDRISEVEDRMVEIKETERKKEKRPNCSKRYTVKSNLHSMRAPQSPGSSPKKQQLLLVS